MTSVNDAQLRSFLLRRLPPAETARLEEAILLEDGFAERLRDEEFDLLDDYAASRLNDEDRAAVERHLLGNEGNLHSLRIARALHGQRTAGGVVDPPSHDIAAAPTPAAAATPIGRSRGGNPSRYGMQRAARVAALLAACVVAIALIPQWRGSARHPETTTSVPSVAVLPIVALVADVARGGPKAVLRIPHGASAIRLQTEVPGPAEDVPYRVRILDSAGKPLFEASGLAIRAAGPYRFVEAEVPVVALGPGERSISLTPSNSAAAAFHWDVTGVLD
jgi:hypothetical protein